MRFVAPQREAVDPAVFAHPPLSLWSEFAALLHSAQWPTLAELNSYCSKVENAVSAPFPFFVAQTPALLADGLHYEQRIAERLCIATRAHNWHDLLNALIWLRFPAMKSALNLRQVAEISQAGTRQRTRAQCALTHFDEGGVIVLLRDPALLAMWDVHDWHGLFRGERSAWQDGRIDVQVFGHALLEHALKPGQLLVGKALVVQMPESIKMQNAESYDQVGAIGALARAIRDAELLNDPQELRPLPLSGIPGWHAGNEDEDFYRVAPCFRPLRAGRRYPRPVVYETE